MRHVYIEYSIFLDCMGFSFGISRLSFLWYYSETRYTLEQKIHVISLNVRQQIALKLMLFNLYVSFMKKIMGDLVDSPNNTTLAIKVGLMQDAFNKYNRLAELLTISNNEPPRNKMLKVHSSYMKYICFAVKGFDANQCTLSEKEIAIIEREYEDLLELVEDSSKFTYSADEIDKWLGRKR